MCMNEAPSSVKDRGGNFPNKTQACCKIPCLECVICVWLALVSQLPTHTQLLMPGKEKAKKKHTRLDLFYP